jgi:transcriptional regulator with XRE-family HTH domain
MANFSDSIVNQQFRKVFTELEKRRLIKGKSDLAKRLGTYNHVVNSILKGERNITLEQLHKLLEIFKLDANYFFDSNDEMFLPTIESGQIPALHKDSRFSGLRNNIILVPNQAMAGYAFQHNHAAYLAELPRFSVPGLDGNFIAFEIYGNSMEPTIANGDIVISELLERGEALRDNNVYVVVTDVVVVKRILQIRNEQGLSLKLISDNKEVYMPYEVEASEIRQMLKVKCRLTSYAIY